MVDLRFTPDIAREITHHFLGHATSPHGLGKAGVTVAQSGDFGLSTVHRAEQIPGLNWNSQHSSHS